MKRKLCLTLVILLILSALSVLGGCKTPPQNTTPDDYSALETKKEKLVASGEFSHRFEKYGCIMLAVNVYSTTASAIRDDIYTVEVTSQFVPGIVARGNGDDSFGKYYNKSGYVHITVIPSSVLGKTELTHKNFYPISGYNGANLSVQTAWSNLNEIQWYYEYNNRTSQTYTITSNYCFGAYSVPVFDLQLDYMLSVKGSATKDNFVTFNLDVDKISGKITQNEKN